MILQRRNFFVRQSSPVVQLFAKYPYPGQVKTRLAQEVGKTLATTLYCELVERQLIQLMDLPRRYRLELWCTEDANAPYYGKLFRRWPRLRYCRQSEGDLGQRLGSGLLRATHHSDCVLQLGTDCPFLGAPEIVRSAELLQRGTDAVFIPAEDGGYVLGGYRRSSPTLYQNIEWSTERVMMQVLHQLWKLDYSTRLLPGLWDIDHLVDLQRYRRWQNDGAFEE